MKLKQLFHVKNVFNNVNMFKWTLQLLSGYTFYIVPDCIRDHHTKFEIDKNNLNIPKLINKKSKNSYA